MKRFILILLLLFPMLSIGQINSYSIDWDGAPDVSPWTVRGVNTFNVTNQWVCQGSHSIRARLRGGQAQKSATLVSEKIGDTNGGEITFAYTYKWLIYDGAIQIPGSANELDLRWQWSNSPSGPWSTFETQNVTTHATTVACARRTITFAPYPGELYVRVRVSNVTDNADNYIYIDDVFIDEGSTPSCSMPLDLHITNKTPTGLTFNWVGVTGQPLLDYYWEIRTGGVPGTPQGLVDSGTTTNTYIDITGLTPSTNYQVYVRVNCDAVTSSFMIGLDTRTHCNIPNFDIDTPIELCGVQDLRINVSRAGNYTIWYDSNDSIIKQSAQPYMDFSQVDTSFTLKVYSGNFGTLLDTIQVGTGSSSTADITPFTDAKAHKIQFIYLASELHAAGFSAGHIKGFGFRVGPSVGTAQRKNFTIHMGETNLEEFGTANRFIPENRLQLVRSARVDNDTLKAAANNVFELDNGFVWDGESNIVVQIAYSDTAPANNPTATANIITSFQTDNSYRTLYYKSPNYTLNQLTNQETGVRSWFRTNALFDVIEGCFGDPKTVEVIFQEAPPLVLSDSIANNCAGQGLDTIHLLSGVTEFDIFTWRVDENDPGFNDNTHPNHPDNAITGDRYIGWSFNPQTPTTYYLTARQSTGFSTDECISYATVHVEFNPSPTMLQLQNSYSLCFDDVEELRVDNFIDDTPTTYLFNGNTNGVTLINTTTGDGLSNDTTLFSEGNASLKVSYAPQTTARLNFNTPINMNNLNSIVVEFDHIAALQAQGYNVYDYGYVEYTTNDGASWKPFLHEHYSGAADSLLAPIGQTSFLPKHFSRTSYQDWEAINDTVSPDNSMWKTERFVVPEEEFITGTGTFKLRFRMGADGNTQYDGWFIDNVRITPISNYQVTWSPISNLYYDQNATVPYDGSINTGVVYLKGNTNIKDKEYTVTVTNQFDCSIEETFFVTIGLKENPGITATSISKCGPLNVGDTGFTKNANGTLYYFDNPTTSSPITQITSSGTYYVEQHINGCISDRLPFTVVINAQPGNPTAILNQSFCGAATIGDLQYNAVSGFQMKWYPTPVGGTALSSTTPLTNGATYYAELDNGACFSENRAQVNVTVGIVPQALVVDDIFICGSTTTFNDITVNAASGATVLWYQTSTSTTPLLNTTVLTSGTYYVAQKIGACESVKTAVNVTNVPTLSAPSASAQTFCGSATVADLIAIGVAAGATEYWYGYSTSDTPLAPSTPLTSGTYYVGQSIGECHSPKQAVPVVIHSINPPTISPIMICGDATVGTLPLGGAQGVTYKVYDSSYATTELNPSTSVTTGTYYISSVQSGCETNRAAVHITVTARPNAPTGNTQQSFVDAAQVSDLVMNESGIVWYASYNDAINGVNPLPSYVALQQGKTYYAVITGPGGCNSLPTAVTVTITVGVNELDLASLNYYPNPAETELTVAYKEPIRTIEVYDLSGKRVKVQHFESNEVRINVTELASGTYMLNVQTDTGSQFIKIVKK